MSVRLGMLLVFWRQPLPLCVIPAHAFVRVHERVFVSSPLFTAVQLALAPRPSRLSREAARAAATENARICRELGIEGRLATAEELLAWQGIAPR